VKLSRIDALTRREHYFLGDQDLCYYFGEYTGRNGRPFSLIGALIQDLLQPRDPAVEKQEYRKDRALGRVAQWLHEVFDPVSIADATFVPLPQSGSGVRTDNDDRMFRILKRCADGLDVRRLIELAGSNASGESSLRAGPDMLYENMRVVLALTEPKPRALFLVDDLLTTGANFVAAKRRILQVIPDIPVFGLFVARKALDSGDVLPP
jgi:predicted amidophosphoribosyltransferase